MRDFEEVAWDCNESQPPWDGEADAWDDTTIELGESDFEEPENFPF